MKKVITILAIAVTSLGFTHTAQAQKFAYVNSEELLMMMPEYQTAAKDVEALATGLQETLERMTKEFQGKYDEFTKGEKTMTETMKEVKTTELQSLDRKIQEFKQTAQEQIEGKKRKLLEPITKKAEEAIKEVAKANGISYVFDMVSTGIIVAPPGDDMLPLLKSKLNLKEPAAGGAQGTAPRQAPRQAPKPAPKR